MKRLKRKHFIRNLKLKDLKFKYNAIPETAVHKKNSRAVLFILDKFVVGGMNVVKIYFPTTLKTSGNNYRLF